jgi:DNA-binding transcriptional LysR family regulator
MNRTSRRPTEAIPLGDVDLRLLRVFVTIVHCNGFSAAQDSLGMSQATISTHMRHLEERLRVRLCERGRAGFFLTDEGHQVHAACLDLFGSIERFRGAMGDMVGELSGQLSFGTVDAMVTNPTLNLDRAIGDFRRRAPRVTLEFNVAAPQVLSQGLLSGAYQVVLMPAPQRPVNMRAQALFHETQKLYCGRLHPLFEVPDAALTPDLLAAQAFAGRSYMQRVPICGVDFDWQAATPHMEGTLILLLSGAYIGFLPEHYATAEVERGRLRALAPERMSFDDLFQIVYARQSPSRAAQAFAQAIARHCVAGSVA